MSDLVDHYDFYAEKGKVEPPKKGQTYLNEEGPYANLFD